MTADPDLKPRGTRLWVRILLVISLAFNLLIIGAVAGVAIKGEPWYKPNSPHHAADAAIGPLTRALSKADRRAIGREMRQSRGEDGWTRRAHRQALERMVGLLEATPFDADAFGTELKGSISGLQGRMSHASDALILRLSQMSDEDRAAFAARVKEEMTRKRP